MQRLSADIYNANSGIGIHTYCTTTTNSTLSDFQHLGRVMTNTERAPMLNDQQHYIVS
jgi:hypothetical protein